MGEIQEKGGATHQDEQSHLKYHLLLKMKEDEGGMGRLVMGGYPEKKCSNPYAKVIF